MLRLIHLLLFLCCFFSAAPASADAPYETFNVKYREIAPSVLRDTTGVVTINADFSWENGYSVKDVELKAYDKVVGSFVASEAISLQKQTLALSSFGYSGIGSYRFPMTEEEGDYCRIVIDPKSDRRIWINTQIQAKGLENGVDKTHFDGLKNLVAVDLFVFTDSGKKKLYAEPNRESSFVVVDSKKHEFLLAAEVKNGFVRLVSEEAITLQSKDGKENSTPRTLGWARIRDNEGLLTLWIVGGPNC